MNNTVEKYMLISHAITAFSKKFKQYLKNELKDSGMSFAEAITLLELNSGDEKTPDQLVKAISYDKSVMTRTLQELETAGLITSKSNPSDERSKLVRITEKGGEATQSVLKIIQQWSEEAYSSISDSELSELLVLLNKLVN